MLPKCFHRASRPAVSCHRSVLLRWEYAELHPACLGACRAQSHCAPCTVMLLCPSAGEQVWLVGRGVMAPRGNTSSLTG